MKASNAVLRIIDANLNRLGEGLRFLEENARFILNDERLTAELKRLRHELSPQSMGDKAAFINAREASNDVGAAIKLEQQPPRRELFQAVTANARRVEESLRVLEELSKTEGVSLDGGQIQSARFAVYNLEKELLSRLMRQDKISQICGLHAVVDTASLGKHNHIVAANAMIDGGARVIQLRDKDTPRKRLLEIAQELKDACARRGALFIVNDALDIALACDADGLHIGQEDLPVKVARRLLPVDKLIGCSVQVMEEARQAREEGADYLGYGAVYATTTKLGCQVTGCVRILEIKREVGLPLVAIGGINKDNLNEVMQCGADGVAVISAILGAPSIEQATRDIIKAMEAYRESAK